MAPGRGRIMKIESPTEVGRANGLAYTLWMPTAPMPIPRGVVILHGADSSKESHHDFARALLPIGCAAIAFDQRGHGATGGFLDGRVLQDVATMAAVLRDALGSDSAPIGLRGSSMGGFLSILAAPLVQASAVVAICPASAEGLARGVRSGRFALAADVAAVLELLDEVDLPGAVAALEVPLLIMHAEGDEQVPVEHSRLLGAELNAEGSRLVTVPGGHHRSIQHDPELQAVSLRFLNRYLR